MQSDHHAGHAQIAGWLSRKTPTCKILRCRKGKTARFSYQQFCPSCVDHRNLYKCRWQIELFFKWIKQHPRIKAFYGTSINAVKTQIWIAVSAYVLVAIIRKRLNLELNLYTILQILSVTLFEKVPLVQLFANYDYKQFPEFKEPLCKLLNLFEY